LARGKAAASAACDQDRRTLPSYGCGGEHGYVNALVTLGASLTVLPTELIAIQAEARLLEFDSPFRHDDIYLGAVFGAAIGVSF
jgi:hypothetical protein